MASSSDAHGQLLHNLNFLTDGSLVSISMSSFRSRNRLHAAFEVRYRRRWVTIWQMRKYSRKRLSMVCKSRQSVLQDFICSLFFQSMRVVCWKCVSTPIKHWLWDFFYWIFFFLDSDAILQCAHLHKQIQSMTALVKWGNCARRVNMSCFLFFLESKSCEGVCVTKAGLKSKTPTRQRRSSPTGPKSWCCLAWRFLVFSEQAALWGNIMISVFLSKHCHQAAPQAASQGNPSRFLPNNTRNLATEAVKKKKELGNLPWKASFASHDFLSEVFGFGICAFFSLTRAKKKQTDTRSQSPQATDQKITSKRFEAGELRCSLSVFRFRFLWRLDGVLLTVSVTPGCR